MYVCIYIYIYICIYTYVYIWHACYYSGYARRALTDDLPASSTRAEACVKSPDRSSPERSYISLLPISELPTTTEYLLPIIDRYRMLSTMLCFNVLITLDSTVTIPTILYNSP